MGYSLIFLRGTEVFTRLVGHWSSQEARPFSTSMTISESVDMGLEVGKFWRLAARHLWLFVEQTMS